MLQAHFELRFGNGHAAISQAESLNELLQRQKPCSFTGNTNSHAEAPGSQPRSPTASYVEALGYRRFFLMVTMVIVYTYLHTSMTGH